MIGPQLELPIDAKRMEVTPGVNQMTYMAQKTSRFTLWAHILLEVVIQFVS